MDNEIHKFFSRINEEVEFIPPNTMFFINWFNQMPRFLKKKYYNQFGNSINFVSFLGFLSIESYNSHTKGRNLAFWNTASKVYDIHSIKRLYSYESRDFPIMLEGNILDPSFVLTYEMVKESLEKIYSPSKGSWKDKGMVAQGTFYKKLHEKSHITLKYNFNSCFYGHTIFLDNFEVLNKFKFYGTILVVNIGNNREKALFKQKSYSFDEILSYRFIALKLIKNSFKKEYTGCEKMFKRYSAPLRPKNHQYKEQLRKQKLVGILPLKLNSYEDTWDFLLTLNYDHLPIFNFLNDVTTQNTLINILKYGFPIFENVWKRNYFSLGFFHPCMILFKFVNKRMIPLFSFFFFDDNPNERIFKIVQNKSKTDSFEPNMLFVFLTMDVLKKRILSLSDEFRTLKNNWLIIIDVVKDVVKFRLFSQGDDFKPFFHYYLRIVGWLVKLGIRKGGYLKLYPVEICEKILNISKKTNYGKFFMNNFRIWNEEPNEAFIKILKNIKTFSDEKQLSINMKLSIFEGFWNDFCPQRYNKKKNISLKHRWEQTVKFFKELAQKKTVLKKRTRGKTWIIDKERDSIQVRNLKKIKLEPLETFFEIDSFLKERSMVEETEQKTFCLDYIQDMGYKLEPDFNPMKLLWLWILIGVIGLVGIFVIVFVVIIGIFTFCGVFRRKKEKSLEEKRLINSSHYYVLNYFLFFPVKK